MTFRIRILEAASDTLSHMSNEQYVAPGERRRGFEPLHHCISKVFRRQFKANTGNWRLFVICSHEYFRSSCRLHACDCFVFLFVHLSVCFDGTKRFLRLRLCGKSILKTWISRQLTNERSVIWSAVFEINWRYDPRPCWAQQIDLLSTVWLHSSVG